MLNLDKIYSLSEENQAQIKDFILTEYNKVKKANEAIYSHFVAQYLKLKTKQKNNVLSFIEQLHDNESLSGKHRKIRHYKDYMSNEENDYGYEQIKQNPNLFSSNFIAYNTKTEQGASGILRFKVDCATTDIFELEDEMNNAFLAKSLTRCDTNVIKLDFKSYQRVTEIQLHLLYNMLSMCQSELIVDLCNDNTIKLTNKWDAVLIMSKDHATKKIIYQGEKIIVENFLKKVNVFF